MQIFGMAISKTILSLLLQRKRLFRDVSKMTLVESSKSLQQYYLRRCKKSPPCDSDRCCNTPNWQQYV